MYRAREDASPLPPSLPPSTPTTPATPTQAPATAGHASMRRLGQGGASSSPHSSLALRRQAAARERNPHRRSLDKLKARTLPTLNSVATERSVEQVMVHTLQMELEGTRDTVIGLERRLDDLHEDLSSISRNVSNLLRMVSQSPCPSMYMSNVSLLPSHLQGNMAASGQLHQGYSFNNMAASCSPSPNPSSMYQTPTFYFSESTDGENSGMGGGVLNDTNGHMTDARDNVSLFSGSNCSPMPPHDIGSFNNEPGASQSNRNRMGENFLSPFQSGHLLKSSMGGSRSSMTGAGGFSTPSPLHSPRVNFTPSPMSSHFPSFPKTPASPSFSRTLADRGGPPPASSSSDNPSKGNLSRLHSPTKHQAFNRRVQTPDNLPSSASPAAVSQSHGLTQNKDCVAPSTPERVKSSNSFPSPKPGRSQSPRPSNLSPLQPRFPKVSQRRFTRASYPGGSSTSAGITMSPLALEINFPSPVSTIASCPSDANASPAQGTDSTGRSPLLGNAARAQEFQGEYYTLTQLEPCDGDESKVCKKGNAMRKSQQDLVRASPSISIGSLQDIESDQILMENQPLVSSDFNDSSNTLRNDRVSLKDLEVDSQSCDSDVILPPKHFENIENNRTTRNSPTQRNQQHQKQQENQHHHSVTSKTPSPTLKTPTTKKSFPSNEFRASPDHIKPSLPQLSPASSVISTTSQGKKAKRPQSLSPSSIRMQNSPQTGSSSCSSLGMDVIDPQTTKPGLSSQYLDGLGPTRRSGSSGFELSTHKGGRLSPARPRASGASPQLIRSYARSASEDVNSRSYSDRADDSLIRSKSSGAETGNDIRAPLSQAESASDLDGESPTS